MSEYPTQDFQQSGRGVLVALRLALGIIACLAVVGAFGSAGDTTVRPGDASTISPEDPSIPID
jgi:hypothetical protein